MEQKEMPQPLLRLRQYQDELTWNLGSDDSIVIRPGLIATFFFEKGSTIEVRKKLIECFDKFYSLFGGKLKGQKYMDAKTKKMGASDYQKSRNKILEITDPHERIEWFVSSEAVPDLAPEYSVSCLTQQSIHEGWGDKSFFKMVLPATTVFDEAELGQYQELVTFICEALQPVHGYGGLSPILPYDYHRYLPNEYELAQRFIGLNIDTRSFSAGGFELKSHIKGVDWYTILGNEFVQQLNGEEAIRATLAPWQDIIVRRHSGGLIIQAGRYPDLGAPDNSPPESYVIVNHLLRSIRTTEPGSLHYYLPQRNGFDKAETVSWYARFDSVPLPEAALESAPAIEGMRCEADKPCPESGYWWTPAMENSRRHFSQGELMPNFPNSTYGSTIWYLEK
ncbi:hypothetical protein C2134_01505 [Chromobacterium sinusclupearum]|uniref:DUF3396 domain-containing protein n=1 Tax=Chromobacterium sinusclupearum TaxID=2077146 RepID=A0A2K4MTP0_9NEIS|nr:type VI immunity family protein [Chromobacterium sinusclupearum]POB00455.1 hypothetical protein C2134_01505 [Chromobacterium sinusclupearum]